MTIDLSRDTEERLRGLASQHGLEPSDYLRQLIEAATTRTAVVDQAGIDLLNQWDREEATDDPQEIAHRQAEVKAFMEGLNRNRLEMEGPPSRKISP